MDFTDEFNLGYGTVPIDTDEFSGPFGPLALGQTSQYSPAGTSVETSGDPVAQIVEQQEEMRGTSSDTRIRLRSMVSQEDQVYGERQPDNIMRILHETGGMLFPYTPTIGVTHTSEYKPSDMVHTNGEIMSYSSTPAVRLSVTGKWTVQNQREGEYLLASLHLLRTVSKMYFGEKDKARGLAGMPPPIMIFSGYGNYMFNDLPVIILNHSYTLDDAHDTVVVNTAGGVARLPSLMTISMELVVQQTPASQRRVFSLDEFRTGALMRSGNKTGWL